MHWLKLIYYGVMALALLASLRGVKYKEYVLFVPLLALSFVVEIARDIYKHNDDINRYLSLFIAVEYTLLALIISNFIHSPGKRRLIRTSIFVLVPLFIFIRMAL